MVVGEILRPVLLATAFATGCSGAAPPAADLPGGDSTVDTVAADLDRLEATLRVRSEAVGAAERSTAELVRDVRAVVDLYDAAAEAYARAMDNWAVARARYDSASQEFRVAAEAYEDAAEGYRLAAIALIGVAAVDIVGLSLCDSTMSTQTYRKQLGAQGIDLDGLHVDHIIPRSLGGADHPANYQLLPSNLNQSLQASGLLEKFAGAPLGFLTALATSALVGLACGG